MLTCGFISFILLKSMVNSKMVKSGSNEKNKFEPHTVPNIIWISALIPILSRLEQNGICLAFVPHRSKQSQTYSYVHCWDMTSPVSRLRFNLNLLAELYFVCNQVVAKMNVRENWHTAHTSYKLLFTPRKQPECGKELTRWQFSAWYFSQCYIVWDSVLGKAYCF